MMLSVLGLKAMRSDGRDHIHPPHLCTCLGCGVIDHSGAACECFGVDDYICRRRFLSSDVRRFVRVGNNLHRAVPRQPLSDYIHAM